MRFAVLLMRCDLGSQVGTLLLPSRLVLSPLLPLRLEFLAELVNLFLELLDFILETVQSDNAPLRLLGTLLDLGLELAVDFLQLGEFRFQCGLVLVCLGEGLLVVADLGS